MAHLDSFYIFQGTHQKKNFFETSFTNYLVYCPPCIIIFFINNFHVYFQCHKIRRCFVVALNMSCNSNWLFRTTNAILNLFYWEIFRINTCFFIKLMRICTRFFSYVLRIDRFFSLVIEINFFSWKIFRMDICFFIKLIRICTSFLRHVLM